MFKWEKHMTLCELLWHITMAQYTVGVSYVLGFDPILMIVKEVKLSFINLLA